MPGVPSASDMVELIRARMSGDLPPECTYQKAFERLIQVQGLDAANEVIQDAVLRARLDAPCSIRDPRAAESDAKGWWISDGMNLLALLVAHHPSAFGQSVLTTNFDPLIEVSLARARAPWFSSSLHGDGSLLYIRGSGTHVVHLHGHWWASDTLHTQTQLLAPRPQLLASLRSLIRDRTLVVVGYGGWDDVLMKAIAEVSEEDEVRPDVLWGFYSGDERAVVADSKHVVDRARRLVDRGRFTMYSGVDFDRLMRQVFASVMRVKPAETLELYLNRISLVLDRCVDWPSGSGLDVGPSESLGECVKMLGAYGGELPARAALMLCDYLLPTIQGHPIHAAPMARRFEWLTADLMHASRVVNGLGADEGERLRRAIMRMGNAGGDATLTDFEMYALKSCAHACCAVLAHANGDSCDWAGGPIWAVDSKHWAAVAVHTATRALHDDIRAAWGYVAARLLGGPDHLARFR
jgi:hypothetical protein